MSPTTYSSYAIMLFELLSKLYDDFLRPNAQSTNEDLILQQLFVV